MTAAPAPVEVRVRMYQVGFGDCFLLTFVYGAPLADGRSERHVLIDCGSTRGPEAGLRMVDVARRIAADSKGKLDVVVVTHRHKDHMSAFGYKSSGAVLDGLKPERVLRPWTEDPAAPADARHLGAASRGFAAAVAGAQSCASAVARKLRATEPADSPLRHAATQALKNKAAVTRLERWSKEGRGRYLHHGSDPGIDALLPGVGVQVLGPPTLEQSDDVASAATRHREYWMMHGRSLRAALSTAGQAVPAGGSHGYLNLPAGPVRALVRRLSASQRRSLLQIVRTLDRVLNNTSLILLFRVGDRRLLFGGDAQIENWQYALWNADESEQIRDELAKLDLYKVGHHGSRNGTPRSIFDGWGEGAGARPITSLLSTLSGVHGESEATHVPRSTLVEALAGRTTLLTTDARLVRSHSPHLADHVSPDAVRFVEVAAKSRGDHAFELSAAG